MPLIKGWAPKNELVEVKIDATVHRSDDSIVFVCVDSMSSEGCEMTAVDTFEIGERLRIQIDRQGFIEAEVRWSSDGRAGAEFLCECHV